MPVASGVGAGQPQRQFVGLAAAAHQVRHAQARGQRRGEPLDVFGQVLVQIAGVGIEQRHLAGGRLVHPADARGPRAPRC